MPNGTAASSFSRPRSRKIRKQQKNVVSFLGPRAPFVNSIPNEARVRLTYGDVWDFAGGANPFKVNTFRINSLFDPDNTGVGGTPSGFATWCSDTGLYNRYEVESVKVTADFMNTHATQICICGMYPYGDLAPAASTGVGFQQKALELGYPMAVLNAAPYERSTATISLNMAMRDFNGPENAHDSSNSALYNANPANPVFLDVFLVNADGATIGPTCRVVVRVEYTIRFSQRNIAHTD